MSNSIYWIWLQLLFGAGTRRSHQLMEKEIHPKELYESRSHSPHLTAEERSHAEQCMEQAKRVEEQTLAKNCRVITPDDASYPNLLRSVYAKPAVLYGKGDMDWWNDALCIAMVGTRKMTGYGEEAATQLASDLALQGAALVSGLAKGIDSAALKAAVEAGGRTVGIMACGLDQDYPEESAGLKRAITQLGAVITEYPLGTKISKERFPVRNRVMAGLCQGTVVVEAGERSGALITARLALEQGRDVFAVPGNIFSQQHRGVHKLLKQGSAKPVASVEDILEEYPQWNRMEAHKPVPVGTTTKKRGNPPKPEKQPLPVGASPEWTALYHYLSGERQTTEQLATQAEIPLAAAMAALTEMEINGLAESHPGSTFTLPGRFVSI